MTLPEQIRDAQQKDVQDMQDIYEAVASGVDPDAAVSNVVGGDFRLSDLIKTTLKG